MYLIGLFSKINRVSAKTLRHYDEIGLLKPEYIDRESGYRYYSGAQLPRLHRILALKQLGLTLEEIRRVLEQPEQVERLLTLKVREFEEQIEQQQSRLSEVKYWLDSLKGEKKMEYTVRMKELPEVTVASRRTVVPSYDSYFEIVPRMGEEMQRQGAECREPAYCFTIYHDGEYKERDIDVEICEAVKRPCADSATVKYKRIPGAAEAACVLHKGPYSTLRDAYLTLFDWVEKNGYRPADKPRESYIDGIWNKEDELEWLTEVQLPVERV